MASAGKIKKKSLLKDAYFLSATGIVLATLLLSLAVSYRRLTLNLTLGPFPLHHWMSLTGASFVAAYIPVYHNLKSRYPAKMRILLKIHIFGNLLSFMLISLHFTHQTLVPVNVPPSPATGWPMYLAMLMLITTGIFRRFLIAGRYQTYWKYLHTSLPVTVYLLIVFHVLRGLKIV